MRQPARQYPAFVAQTELAEHVETFLVHFAVVLRKGCHLHSLAITREDGERDVVEHGQSIEQVDDLKAARDPRPDPLVNSRGSDVLVLEQDAPAVGSELRADKIDE